MRQKAFILFAFVIACGNGNTTAATDPAPGANCAASRDSVRVPLNDFGTGCYKGVQAGLYLGGSNTMPAAHLQAGLAAAAAIRPLDVNGQPSASGKIVLLSIGMSNTTQEFCSNGGLPGSCEATSFIAQAAADPAVNHTTLAIVNGAYGGKSAEFWVSPTLPDYDRIKSSWLTPLGLSERQVQVAWVKVANPGPRVAMPAASSDAAQMTAQLGNILRALKVRYPNLRQVFLTSRIYAGYATSTLNPEPYAYETGFSVKWAVQSQVEQAAGGAGDARTGDVRYSNGVAPWAAWGPYPWANGTQPRSDGLTWERSDFNSSDYTHPASAARQKVAAMLLSFFKTSPVTRCWFLAGQGCQ